MRMRAVVWVAVCLAVTAACSRQGAPTGGGAVERGQYLVTISGCHDCHTPLKMGAGGPEPDMTLMLSGHQQALQLAPPPAVGGGWMWVGAGTMTAFAGPWGISYAANLTPDEETGTGAWSEENFVKAMRTGQHLGAGRPILPPMPWQNVGKMTDGDLKAVFAYLKSIPPIKNQVPGPVAPGGAQGTGAVGSPATEPPLGGKVSTSPAPTAQTGPGTPPAH